MPDITTAPNPVSPPTTCFRCRTHANPDGFAYGPEIPHYGTVWECAQCCRDLGRAFGMVAATELEAALETCREQADRLAVLEAELAAANAPENKVLTFGDAVELAKVIDLGAERTKRRPKTTSAA